MRDLPAIRYRPHRTRLNPSVFGNNGFPASTEGAGARFTPVRCLDPPPMRPRMRIIRWFLEHRTQLGIGITNRWRQALQIVLWRTLSGQPCKAKLTSASKNLRQARLCAGVEGLRPWQRVLADRLCMALTLTERPWPKTLGFIAVLLRRGAATWKLYNSAIDPYAKITSQVLCLGGKGLGNGKAVARGIVTCAVAVLAAPHHPCEPARNWFSGLGQTRGAASTQRPLQNPNSAWQPISVAWTASAARKLRV